MAGRGPQGSVGLIMPTAVFPALDPGSYRPHPLHAAERAWPETNCYVDLWIEVLSSLGLPPEAMLGFTVAQDFEGDQVGFFKVPLEDLEQLYGIRVGELAIFDHVEAHILTQIDRGRLCLVEMDSYFLPDTAGISYRRHHGKTTVGIDRLDPAQRRMAYFHNGGYFALEGEDFDGLFRRGPFGGLEVPFLPYTEFAKFDHVLRRDDWRTVSLELLRRHLARRPAANPVAAFAAAFPGQARALAGRDAGLFDTYAFNTLRQLGANFGLLAGYLDWLQSTGETGLAEAAAAAATICDTAKVTQFQLARALARQRFDALATQLDPAVAAWDQLMDRLDRRYRA